MATEKKTKTTTKAPKAKTPKKPAAKTAVKEGKVAKAVKTTKAPKTQGGAYIYGRGRRKSAIARVRVVKNGSGDIRVNDRLLDEYFTSFELQNIVRGPLKTSGQETALDVSIKVEGGGVRGQAEAARLGISRALIELNPTFRTTLKKLGYLSRDARVKERKKPGLKKARRAPQWSKR